MKSLTCKQLGGTCGHKISANTWDELVQNMTKHVVQSHPDVAEKVEQMHGQDLKKMGSRDEAEVGMLLPRMRLLVNVSLATRSSKGFHL
jgi:predicted small metal-binding protein